MHVLDVLAGWHAADMERCSCINKFPVAFFLEPISSILEYEDILLLIPIIL
jgi:hypothetical protein